MTARSHDLPLVSLQVLRALEEDLGDASTGRIFVENFIEMWSNRLGKLTVAVSMMDRAAAMDAILSVKISSAMVGAPRLAKLSEEIQHLIRDAVALRTWSDAMILVDEIDVCGQETMQQLTQQYLQK
jgi:HPt (histidine-containing phosphotransfer) domain-containing protein